MNIFQITIIILWNHDVKITCSVPVMVSWLWSFYLYQVFPSLNGSIFNFAHITVTLHWDLKYGDYSLLHSPLLSHKIIGLFRLKGTWGSPWLDLLRRAVRGQTRLLTALSRVPGMVRALYMWLPLPVAGIVHPKFPRVCAHLKLLPQLV